MPKIIENIKHTVDVTIPDRQELPHGLHPKIDYIFLVLRNIFSALAVLFFIGAFFLRGAYGDLKAVGYFMGAIAYIFECLAVTDCFRAKVPHTEMFMVYCFGPLYILMGFEYIFLH